MIRQFTATTYVIDNGKVLLIYHKKLQKWLPPGGHLEPHELPSEGAKREVFEETGLHVELIKEENVWIESTASSRSFERPFMCLIETIPPHGEDPAHEHIDFIYVGKVIGGTLLENEEETGGIRWVSLEELPHLREDELFIDTRESIQTLLTHKSNLYPNELKSRFLGHAKAPGVEQSQADQY